MLDVVIVEDEDIIRQGLVYMLDWAAMGCKVVGSAGNGEEGGKIIRSLNPDIVLTDIKMPRKNGIKMIEECLPFGHFKTIILTSYSEFEYAQQAVRLHVFEYLLKPVDEHLLKTVVAKIRREFEQDSRFIQKKSGVPLSLPETQSGDTTRSKLLDRFNIHIAVTQCSNAYIRKTLKKIIVSYNEPLGIETTAAELGISSSYLSRLLKEYTGETFVSILNLHRIYKACELIASGDYRINEIANICGFSEYKYFHAVFKKYTGERPGVVQARLKV